MIAAGRSSCLWRVRNSGGNLPRAVQVSSTRALTPRSITSTRMGVKWKTTRLRAVFLQHAATEQGVNVAVNGLDVAIDPARHLADAQRTRPSRGSLDNFVRCVRLIRVSRIPRDTASESPLIGRFVKFLNGIGDKNRPHAALLRAGHAFCLGRSGVDANIKRQGARR